MIERNNKCEISIPDNQTDEGTSQLVFEKAPQFAEGTPKVVQVTSKMVLFQSAKNSVIWLVHLLQNI